MIDAKIHDIEKMRDEGAIVIVKWDGQRTSFRQTVVVTRSDTDFVWRKDCEDIARTLEEAVEAYRSAHDR